MQRWTISSLYNGLTTFGESEKVTDIYRSVPIKSSEITPYSSYLSRREFIKAAGLLTGSALLAACAPKSKSNSQSQDFSQKKDEFGDSLTPLDDITHYNNYFEFSERKDAVSELAKNFKPK